MKKLENSADQGRFWVLGLIVFIIALGVWMFFPKTTEDGDSPTNFEHRVSSMFQSEGSSSGGAGSMDSVAPDDKEDVSGRKRARPVTIVGKVVMEETGLPVAHALVKMTRARMRSRIFGGPLLESNLETTSDAKGNFVLKTFKKGRFDLFATKNELISMESSSKVQRLEIDSEAESVGPITLNMYEAASVVLDVVSSTEKQPLEGVKVSVTSHIDMQFEGDTNGIVHVKLAPGLWSLLVSAPGHEKKALNIDLGRGREKRIRVELSAAARLYGQVTDQMAAPVQDADVWANFDGVNYQTKSNQRGEYELDHLPVHATFYLVAMKDGYMQKGMSVSMNGQWEKRQDIVLLDRDSNKLKTPRLGTVEGWVFMADGEPAPKTVIEFLGRQYDKPKKVQTDASGFYSIDLLETDGVGGAYTAMPLKDGFFSIQQAINVQPLSISQCNFVLMPSNFLSGHVVDPDGNPIPDVTLRVTKQKQRNSFEWLPVRTTSDNRGFFEIKDLPERIAIEFKSKGFQDHVLKSPELNQTDLLVELTPDVSIVGRVIDGKSQKPIEEFQLFIEERSSRGSFKLDQNLYEKGVVFNHPNGEFIASGFRQDQSLLLFVKADGYLMKKPVSFVFSGDSSEKPLVIELDTDGDEFDGYVLDKQGQPIAGAHLVLKAALNWFPPDHSRGSLAGYSANIAFRSTTYSDATGYFKIEKVPGNLYRSIEVVADGYIPKFLSFSQESAKKDMRNLEITLAQASQIEISLKGKGWPKNIMVAYEPRGFLDRTNTYRSEAFPLVLDGLDPASFTIKLFAYNENGEQVSLAKPKNGRIRAGETQYIEFQKETNKTLSGIALVQGQPVVGRSIRLIAESESPSVIYGFNLRATVETDSQGGFRFEGLSPGSYKLVLFPRNQPSLAHAFQLGFGLENSIELKLGESDLEDTFHFRKFSIVTGRLVNARKVWQLHLVPLSGRGRSQSISVPMTANKHFRVLDVAPGKYKLEAMLSGVDLPTILKEELVIPKDGADVDVGDIDASEPGSFRMVAVSMVSNQALPITVHNMSENSQNLPNSLAQQYIWQNPSEPFVLPSLKEGNYAVFVKGDGAGVVLEPTYGNFEVRGGEETDVTVGIEAVTLFQVWCPEGQLVRAATLTNLETMQSVGLQSFNGELQSLFNQQKSFAIFTNDFLMGRGIAPGLWQLELETHTGQKYVQKMDLKRGEKISFRLGFARKASL